MKPWRALAVAWIVAAWTAGLLCAQDGLSGSSQRLRYAGWVTYWDFDRGIAAVTDPLSPLEGVYLFSVHLDPRGRPTFTDPDIDCENLRPEDRSSFVSFVGDLAKELKDAGLVLSVTVQPKVRESSRQGPGAMDWKRLCEHADQLQIMLYNLHSQATPPGPLATPGWVQEVLSFARQECGVERVAPILKLSGLRWGLGRVQRAHFAEAVELMEQHSAELQRHPAGEVPYFSYLEEQARSSLHGGTGLRTELDSWAR
jgi:hypothetical protein